MADTKKKTPAKAPVTGSKTSPAPKGGQAEKVAKAAEAVFGKLKTHFEPKKVDAWQGKWLAVPANRKKYEKIADAPEVVGEELVAMTNDIIDFIQGEEGGKSGVFRKVKSKMSGFLKNPIGFLQKQTQSKAPTEKAGNEAKKGAEKSKITTKKPVKKAGKAAKK